MASESYMPRKKAAQVAWFQEFVDTVEPMPGAYGIPAPMMSAFANLNAQLQEAWKKSEHETTRTRVTIDERDVLLAQLKVMVRNLVSIIQGTPSATSAMKIAAGLTVRDKKPTPKPVPSVKPVLVVTQVDGRTVTMELRSNLTKRGKPVGVAGATVFTATGAAAPQSTDAWKFAFNTTQTKVEFPFPPSETGETVWITAFWNNAKDQSGPAATPVCVELPRSTAAPAASTSAMKLQSPALKAA